MMRILESIAKASMELLKAPYKLFKAILSLSLLAMVAIALYSYGPVKKTVDKVLERVHVPDGLKETASKGMEIVGLKEKVAPQNSFSQKVGERVKAIPEKSMEVAKSVGSFTLDRLLDLIFHPITIIVIVGVVCWKFWRA